MLAAQHQADNANHHEHDSCDDRGYDDDVPCVLCHGMPVCLLRNRTLRVNCLFAALAIDSSRESDSDSPATAMAASGATMETFTEPASCKGKHDPGIPIYVTGGWKTGLTGGYSEIFERLQAAGFGAYRWDKPEHNAHGDRDQYASILEYLSKIKAFVMLSENPTAGGGASQLMLGYALLRGVPVIFVDPNAGQHVRPGRTNADHPMLANLIGSATQLSKQLTIVKTLEEALDVLTDQREKSKELWRREKERIEKQAAAAE